MTAILCTTPLHYVHASTASRLDSAFPRQARHRIAESLEQAAGVGPAPPRRRGGGGGGGDSSVVERVWEAFFDRMFMCAPASDSSLSPAQTQARAHTPVFNMRAAGPDVSP